jgi:hypothetical protein
MNVEQVATEVRNKLGEVAEYLEKLIGENPEAAQPAQAALPHVQNATQAAQVTSTAQQEQTGHSAPSV